MIARTVAVLVLALIVLDMARPAQAGDPELAELRKALEGFQVIEAAKGLDALAPSDKRCLEVGDLMLTVPLTHPLFDDLDQNVVLGGRAGALVREHLGGAFVRFVDRAKKKVGSAGAELVALDLRFFDLRVPNKRRGAEARKWVLELAEAYADGHEKHRDAAFLRHAIQLLRWARYATDASGKVSPSSPTATRRAMRRRSSTPTSPSSRGP